MSIIRLEGAKAIYAVANTPAYLLKHLRKDPSIILASSLRTPEDLFEAALVAIREKPVSLEDEVLPYALVASLTLQNNAAMLARLREFEMPYHRWLPEVVGSALARATPTTFKAINLAHPIQSSPAPVKTAANTRLIIP